MTPFILPSPLCDAAASLLVVVDIQQRLVSAMAPAERERVARNAGVLVQAAGLLAVPVLATEQYPKGLGPTDAALSELLPGGHAVIEKTCFACSANEHFIEVLREKKRQQIVIAGMEAHVCVLQTAMELKTMGYTVFVVEDAVCSRSEANYRNALARLRDAGVIVTNTESVVFEWLRDAKHEHFKAVSALIK